MSLNDLYSSALTAPNKIGLVIFDGTATQRVSVLVNSSTIGNCANGAVKILRPDGTSVRSDNACTGSFLDPVTLLVTGTYTLLVDPWTANTGQITLTLHEVIDLSGTMTIGGPSVSANLTTPGQVARWTFTGAANQKVSVLVNSSTIGSCANASVKILQPDGASLGSAGGCTGHFLEPVTLPVTGTYTLLVDPYSEYTGQITLTLHEVIDLSGTMTIGGPSVSANLTTPGQVARWTFSGTANQKVSVLVNSSTLGSCTNASVKILHPDGTSLGSEGGCTGYFLEPVTLPVTGTYTLLVNPYSEYTGQITLTLYDVVDLSGTLTPGGPSATANITTPGQVARWTFSGTANQKVSVLVNSSTISSCTNGTLSILKPDGTVLVTAQSLCTNYFLAPATLPVTGTYTLLVNPYSEYTGQITLTLYDVVDLSGTLTIGGPAVSVTLTTPGQVAQLTFSGTANQQVTVRVTSNTMGSVTVKLLKPDGTTLTSKTSSAASFNLTTQTLPTTGTYTVLVDPSGANIGSLNVSVTSP
jgi:type II secretory pathway component PulM